MIYANISDKENYRGLGWLMTALDNAEKYSDPSLDIGAYPIEEGIRAVVNRYTISGAALGEFENHRDYIDVHYIIYGRESIAVRRVEKCTLVKEYDQAADYEMYKIDKTDTVLEMNAGDFAVLFPGEAHYPGFNLDGEPSKVRKIVFKVRV